MTGYLRNCVAIAATIGFSLACAPPAKAEAMDFFKCKMKDTTTMAQVTDAVSSFLKDAAKNGHDKYSVRLLSPVYSTDITAGVFWWVGVGPSLGSVAAENEYWASEANRTQREKFNALIKDCESSSLHQVTEVKAAN